MTDKPIWKIGDIVGARIIKVMFNQKPGVGNEEQTPFLAAAGVPDAKRKEKGTSYQVDSGNILLILDNGLSLQFWNSEWGGMEIYPKNRSDEEIKYDNLREISEFGGDDGV